MTTAILLTIIATYLVYRNWVYFCSMNEGKFWGAVLILLVFVPLILTAIGEENKLLSQTKAQEEK